MSLQSGHYIEADYVLNHPAQNEKAVAAIEKITIAVTEHLSDSWFNTGIPGRLNRADIEFVDSSTNDSEYKLLHFTQRFQVLL